MAQLAGPSEQSQSGPAALSPTRQSARGLRGLSSEQARERLAQLGPNALPPPEPVPLWRRVLRQLRSALIYVLLFALVVDFGIWLNEGALGVPLEALAIAAILALNTVLGVWQEYRAEDALSKLRELEAPQAQTLRDGRLCLCASRELVPGDVVRIASGGRVPADGCVDGEGGLLLDESILTGESVPVERSAGEEVFAGTLVVRGSAYCEVTRTGTQSAMGRIAGMLGSVQADPTPLERRLQAFGNRIAGWVTVLALALVVGGVLAEGLASLDEAFVWAVALAVAAIPEGLPAVLTLTLALGVERMSRRQAVVRKLAAVEALGSVTVIATDKTGTLTENRMLVREVDTPDPSRALRAMVLANEAEPDTGAGDPLENGLFAYAREQGIDPIALRLGSVRQSTRAFDGAWKFMRATVAEAGGSVSYLKGAPEVLLARSALSDEARRAWFERAEAAAARGLRVLALACGRGEVERGLDWLGLVLFWDPPRAEVPDAVRAARAAGVRVLMVTGDHPTTAAAIARTVGIDAEHVTTGAELDALAPGALAEQVARSDVYARVTPEHKLQLVEALKQRGEIVAMTGDGVNDAPALKRADVGVAMGRRGSDVSREVADLVLLDDNFATIVSAIDEGRNIYENVRKFIHFLFSTNVSLVLLVSLGAVGSATFGLRDVDGALLVPLTAVQLLWINIISNGPPALAVGLDRTPGVMQSGPRPRDAALLDRRALRFVLVTGSAKAAVGLTLLVLLPLLGYTTSATRTAVFLFESIAQLAYVYPSRQLELRPLPNRVLNAIVVLSVLLQPLLVWFPATRRLLALEPIDLPVWGILLAGVAISFLSADLYGRRLRAAALKAREPRGAARVLR
jgi:Ca2+-transporting ATPase